MSYPKLKITTMRVAPDSRETIIRPFSVKSLFVPAFVVLDLAGFALFVYAVSKAGIVA